ncbi:hypothetical protein GCM10011487_30040 [Steroidobacter agaridevorans]|uniref:DUF6249 domain-containing protein n=1 Tax=Steroidobacter agaridevorans TaxID=2695856 RepID=A0A829YC81_9GAMM|nr:hypothetical protein GCM10011487_30040 [Steroidobacter agaridevorans]GFE89112.1 hypothetical protein GCM10011488_40660 [Steroidobacter agaridevorans]
MQGVGRVPTPRLEIWYFEAGNMLSDLVPILAIVFSLGLPLSAVIIWIALNYRKRVRLMELSHAERMAAIERGMEVPPLPLELIDGQSRRRPRSSLLPGLVWFFIGLAMVAGSISIGDDLPVVFGLVPLAIGLAYLIYYAVEGRHVEARQQEQDMRDRAERNGRYSQGPATL